MSSQEGKSDKGHREAGGHAQTEVETGGVWPGARNTWSSWGGSSELQKAGIPARHLDFEFSASRTAGEEVGVKPQQLSLRSSEQEPAQLALVISSVLAKWGLFLKLESGIGHRCYSMSWCQVTVMSRPNSDQATAGQLRSYVCDPSKAPCPLASSVSRGDPHLGQVCSSDRVESQGWEDTGRES